MYVRALELILSFLSFFLLTCAGRKRKTQIALCAEFDYPHLMDLLRSSIEYSLEKVTVPRPTSHTFSLSPARTPFGRSCSFLSG